jgi:hypothetical protein
MFCVDVRRGLAAIGVAGIMGLLAGSSAAGVGAAEYPRELLENGDFETASGVPRWPQGWPRTAGATWQRQGRNHFLRLEVGEPGQAVSLSKAVPLALDWGKVRVSCRVRYQDIVPGKEGWHDGRIAMSFHDAQGKQVGGWPNVLHWSGTSADWTTESRDYAIPAGATRLNLDLALFYVEKGRLDLDDVQVTVLGPRPKPEDLPQPAGWEPAMRPYFVRRDPARSVLSLNGPWQMRPMGIDAREPQPVKAALLENPLPLPRGPGWGWTKLPAVWPGTGTEGHQARAPEFWEDHPAWRNPAACWYQRSVPIPAEWNGRRIVLRVDLPQTQAVVFVDGRRAGQVRWPEGQVDLTPLIEPGQTALFTLFVTAEPPVDPRLPAPSADALEKARANIRFRGLAGDILLEARLPGPSIAEVQFRPSVRNKQLGLLVTLEGVRRSSVRVALETAIDGQREFRWTSDAMTPDERGTLELAAPWRAKRLWDLDAPNLYDVRLALLDSGGRAQDEIRRRIGFREVWLQGREIILNGTPVHWRALDFGNHTQSLAMSSKAECAATLRRMRRLGFNFVIMANYGFEPGENASFSGLLEAADELGFLMSFSLPHPVSLPFGTRPEDQQSQWQELTGYCLRAAQNHPAVLAYAMSHNVLGYYGDQNPAKMDGRYQPGTSNRWLTESRRKAAAAEDYVHRRDPTRPLYHHQSGHMGQWHTVNIYLNWAPLQERMDWLSHWAAAGVTPMFFVEWGLPHQASWGRHRQGPFIWTNTVSSEPLAVEYGAAVTGEAAYRLTPDEERHIDNYERVYARGEPFHYSAVMGDYWEAAREHNFVEVQSAFTAKGWPALRTWGLSALLPWDQGNVARPRAELPAVPPQAAEPADQWAAPGIHPDLLAPNFDYFQSGGARTFQASSLGRTFQRVNQDVLAWLAGDPRHFTEQGHLFRPGETIRKQAILINDRRRAISVRCAVVVRAGGRVQKLLDCTVTVAPGRQERLPLVLAVPRAAGEGEIALRVTLDDGTQLSDRFALEVLAPPEPPQQRRATALWDPKGLSTKELARLGIAIRAMAPEEASVPAGSGGLIVGRESLSVDGPLPDIGPLLARRGRVVVFEQAEDVLSRRLGFRTNAPSLRSVFPRARHPAVAGLGSDQLRDWRGCSSLTPDRFSLPDEETSDPPVDWLGFKNTRAWKWGNWGQVASVVIEKPQAGDFTALADGGFDLQYAPLLLWRAPSGGEILFCQMDVTARTESDPAADRLVSNLVRWAGEAGKAEPPPGPVPYLGDPATLDFLRRLGADAVAAGGAEAAIRSASPTLLVGPGARVADVRAVLAGLDSREATALLLFQSRQALEAFGDGLELRPQAITHTVLVDSDLAQRCLSGVGPAELHFRGRTPILGVFPRRGWSLASGALAAMRLGQGQVVFCQIDPRRFDYTQPHKIYLKLTHNRAATLLARVLANCGVPLSSRLPEYWSHPPAPGRAQEPRWQASNYLDKPIAADDPYRYNRW